MERRLKELEDVEVIMPKYINIKIDVNEDCKNNRSKVYKKLVDKQKIDIKYV